MRHMIKWLKICALLLTIMLGLHTIEIIYDIMYHDARGYLFQKHADHADDKSKINLNKGSMIFIDFLKGIKLTEKPRVLSSRLVPLNNNNN